MYVDGPAAEFQGLIDFGDAYISHPAFDLRPWRDPDDAAALVEGYVSEGPIDDAFIPTMRVGMVVGELAALVRGREASHTGAAQLQRLLAHL